MQKLTTLVLGAGSSVPYGLPTGSALAEQAVDFLTFYPRNKFDIDSEIRNRRDRYGELSTYLKRSRTPTIDNYIQHNKMYAVELKSAIAGCIWKKEQDALGSEDIPDDDWIAWLYHEYLGAPDPDEIQSHNLVFLSFNYDRLPAALMATMMANTHLAPVDECVKAIQEVPSEYKDCLERRTLHIHGAINAPLERYRDEESRTDYGGRLTNECSYKTGRTEQYCRELSKNILVIHENTDSTQKASNHCKRAIKKSDQVIFLGFGYHDSNLDRLGITPFRLDDPFDRTTRLGGTAFGIKGESRGVLSNKLGSRFLLGDPEERCREFLSRFLL